MEQKFSLGGWIFLLEDFESLQQIRNTFPELRTKCESNNFLVVLDVEFFPEFLSFLLGKLVKAF